MKGDLKTILIQLFPSKTDIWQGIFLCPPPLTDEWQCNINLPHSKQISLKDTPNEYA